MPTFDRTTSLRDLRGAEILRGVLGAPKPYRSPLMSMAVAYRRKQRRLMFKRTLVVLILIGAASAPALIGVTGPSASTSVVPKRTQ